MTTTNHRPGDEIVGADIEPASVIGVRDRSVFGYHTDQFLVIVVHHTVEINDMLCYVDGSVIMADDTWVSPENVIVTIANAEPIDYYGDVIQAIVPWERDVRGLSCVMYARGLVTAVRAIQKEVNQ